MIGMWYVFENRFGAKKVPYKYLEMVNKKFVAL